MTEPQRCDACGEPIDGEVVEAAPPPLPVPTLKGGQPARTGQSYRPYHPACAADLPTTWVKRGG